MTGPESRQRRWPATARKTWWKFWFRPQPAYTLGLVRMAFGALAIGWTMSLLPDLYALFGPHGVVPKQPEYAYLWGAFAIWTSDQALLIGWILLLVSAIALMVGWHSRLAALAAFILIVSFEHRNIWVFNAGDTAIRIEALLLAISPCGTALSLDQRRATGKFWSAQERPQWPVRLMQVQLSLIYLAAAQAKLNGNAWPQGTAVSYALRLPDMLLLSHAALVHNQRATDERRDLGRAHYRAVSRNSRVERAITAMGARRWRGYAHHGHGHHRCRVFQLGRTGSLPGVYPTGNGRASSAYRQPHGEKADGEAS